METKTIFLGVPVSDQNTRQIEDMQRKEKKKNWTEKDVQIVKSKK